MKNLLLAIDHSVVDNKICPPPSTQPEDLGDLLSTVAERLESNGVLMLTGGLWGDYVRPYSEQAPPEPAAVHCGDWGAKVAHDDVWIRWTNHDGHAIWTCEVDALAFRGKNSPLIEPNPMLTALNMHTWTETTGAGWVGTPGMTGNNLLIDTWTDLHPKAPAPRWNTSGIWLPVHGGDTWTYGQIEQPFTTAKWARDYDGPMHGYDLNKCYLSAYQTAELPADSLEHRPKGVRFDPRMGGIWRVELSDWRFGHLLPDPAGYGPALDDGTRWLTTPTLALLQQITDRGDYSGFTVREAWTAPARRITRKWAELINDVAGAARDPLNTAAKQVYKQTYGMWVRRGRIYRPDWHYTIIAVARANMWRKLDTALRAGSATLVDPDTRDRQIPVRVETDCVFYATGAHTTWEELAPPTFKLDPSGIKLGHFKPYADKGEQ